MIKRLATTVTLLLVATQPAHADDRKQAAEHFALAESAEKRKDWSAAIAEYELAYAASPHPATLFNIASNYERLDQRRNAATYFRRYVDESTSADDRDEVLARIEKLRSHPSQVTVKVIPAGALVFIDGEQRGTAPTTLTLPAGEHQLHVTHSGRRSPPRQLVLEYGDPVTVLIDLDSQPGVLIVASAVRDAEIRLDGEVIGHTPYSGAVPAGEYQLLISKAGYQTIQRKVTIRPQGSQQIRANLTRVAGSKDPATEAHARYLMGMGYGFDIKEEGVRYLFEAGYRSPSKRWEVTALLGTLSGSGGGIGAGARLFISTGRIRPYLRAGIMAASPSSGSDRITLLEGGAGVLIIGRSPSSASATTSPRLIMDYFVEANLTAQIQQPDADQARFGIPIVAGLMIQFGR